MPDAENPAAAAAASSELSELSAAAIDDWLPAFISGLPQNKLAIAAALVVVLSVLYFQSKEWRRARDIRMADEEAESMRRNPRVFMPDELLPYNGLNPRKPLLLAISGRVLDVRQGADYYGPGGPYKVMAGRDASKAFAMMSLKEEDAHPDLTGVDESHLKILDDWFDKLTAKYPTVGRVAQSGAPPCSARAADAAPDAARADGGDDADDWYLGPNATPRAGEVRRGTRSKSPARDDS